MTNPLILTSFRYIFHFNTLKKSITKEKGVEGVINRRVRYGCIERHSVLMFLMNERRKISNPYRRSIYFNLKKKKGGQIDQTLF